MPTAKNLDELFKMLDDEDILYDQLIGQTIDYTCPYCKKEVKLKLLKGRKATCPSCKKGISISLDTK